MKFTRAKMALAIGCAGILAAGAAFIFHAKPHQEVYAKGPAGSDFTLLDQTGTIRNLHNYSKREAVIVAGFSNSCAGARDILQDLVTVAPAIAGKNIAMLLVDSGGQAERVELADAAAKLEMNIPILLDDSGVVSKTLHLKNSAEAVVLQPPEWRELYRGDLSGALAFKNIPFNGKGRAACALPDLPQRTLSYNRVVAPLIARKCLNCHVENKRFKPYLDSYARLTNWSAMIRETLLTDRMPPFSSDPLYGHYSNDISLEPAEKRLLVDWIDAGLPREAGADPIATLPRRRPRAAPIKEQPGPFLYSAGMAEPFTVPSGGTNEYRYFQLGGPVPFDMWVNAIETRSTNPRQLHHESLMMTRKPLAELEDEIAPKRNPKLEDEPDGNAPAYVHRELVSTRAQDENYVRVQNWAAGKIQPVRFMAGTAIYIPKGYYLILEVHHMGTGRVEQEQTTLDFYGERVHRGHKALHGMELWARQIVIPPGESDYRAISKPYKIFRDVEVLSFLGHMHMRGRAVKVVETDPAGAKRVIASIPNFYYGWQTGAGLAAETPIVVKRGSTLQVACEYDNSAENPNNPDPTKSVHIGQRVDRAEMCKMSMQYVYR